MNQILTTKPVKTKKHTNIKSVKTFFAISLIVFGICLLTSGSYAVFMSISSKGVSNENNNSGNTPVETSNEEIQITLSQEGSNIKASIKGEKEISFVTYKWDDEEESREDIGGVSGEITIDIPAGEHTLNVTAVDVKNNTATKTIKALGVKRPKIEIKQEGQELAVYISDEIGLSKVELKLNGEDPYVVETNGAKNKEFRAKLEAGENTLEVTAYNTNGYTETFNALCRN